MKINEIVLRENIGQSTVAKITGYNKTTGEVETTDNAGNKITAKVNINDPSKPDPNNPASAVFATDPNTGETILQMPNIPSTDPKQGDEITITPSNTDTNNQPSSTQINTAETREEDQDLIGYDIGTLSDEELIDLAKQYDIDLSNNQMSKEELINLLNNKISEIGGDQTDDFINDVTNKEYGQLSELARIRYLSGL